jgi:putative copper resistance protein D
MEPDAALSVCRFVHDACTMLVWGGAGCLAALVPGGLAADVAQRLRPYGIVAAVVAVAAMLTMLPVEAALLGNGWSDAFSGDALTGFLFDTGGGAGWAWQAATSILVVVALFLPARRRLGATAVVAGIALATLPLTGHAVMRDGATGVAQRANDAVHVLAAGAWFGALVPLALVLRKSLASGFGPDAATTLRRFSIIGQPAVALVLITGVANTLLILRHLPTDWSSPYQALLALKIAVVAVMIALAIANRSVVMGRIATGEGAALTTLRRTVRAEIAFGFAAIALVAVFGTLDPA